MGFARQWAATCTRRSGDLNGDADRGGLVNADYAEVGNRDEETS